jgi:hypothetical protein
MKAFEAQFALKPRAGKDNLSKEALAFELGISHTHPVVRQTWQRLRDQINQGLESGVVEINGQHIEWNTFYSDRNVKLPFVSRGSLNAFRAAMAAEPEKATGDELSLSRLADMLSLNLQGPFIRNIISVLDGEIADGKKEGVARIGTVNLPWRLVKAVWGGSSKYGGLSPHVHISAVEGLLKELEGHKPAGTDDRALDTGVEEVREIALNVASSEGNDPLIVYAKAIATADDTLMFEVGGLAHLVVGDREVFRAFEEDGEVSWHRSTIFKRQGGIARVERSDNRFTADQAIDEVAHNPVTRWDLSAALGVTPRHSMIQAVYSGIDDDIKNGHSFGSVRIGSAVFPWIKGKMPHGGSYAPLLPPSAVSALRELAASRPMASADYLSREGLMEELGEKTNRRFIFRLWATIGSQAERGPDRGLLLVEGNHVHWRYLYTTTGSRFPYISRASVPALRAVLAYEPTQVKIEAVTSPVFDMLESEPRNAGQPSADIVGEDLSTIRIGHPDGSSDDREAILTKSGNFAILGVGPIRLVTPDGVLMDQFGSSWRRDEDTGIEFVGSSPSPRSFKP